WEVAKNHGESSQWSMVAGSASSRRSAAHVGPSWQHSAAYRAQVGLSSPGDGELLVCAGSGGDRLAARKGELHDQRALERAEIVVRHDGNDGLAAAATHADRLHIVDVQSVGRFEKHLTLYHRTGLDLACRHAADAHFYPLIVAKSSLEDEEVAIG